MIDSHKIGEDLKIVGNTSMLTVTGVGLSMGVMNPKAKAIEPKDSAILNTGSKPWALWGDGDDWPQRHMEDLDKLGVAKGALNLNADLHYGSGIQWMREQVSDEGKLTHIIDNPKLWRRWSNLSGFNRALSEAIHAADTFGRGFIRVQMALDGKVYKCKALDAPSCRLQKRGADGKIKNVYYAQDIHLKSDKDDKTVVIPFYDDEDDIVEFSKNNPVFVFSISYSSFTRFYYPEPDYYAAFRAGWADVCKAVPNLIKNIYKNQATLKYHIKIPYSYFKLKFKDWEEMEQKDQLIKYDEYRTEIEGVISNAEASGKSVFSMFADTEGYESLSIEPIKSALDTSKDLPNNTAANSEILFPIGIDPSLLGLVMPGGKDLNGGGGSQRRESLKIKQATLTRERLVSAEFVWAIGILNEYQEDIYPMFIDIDVSQTLDENPTGKRAVVA